MAKRGSVRVIPLGGVAEVGKNATVIEAGNDLLLVDAGVKFPEEEMYGIDLIIPDFSYVVEHADRLRGIVLTHGHEDHIGALSYLLRQLGQKVAVYGTPLTLGMAMVKLREQRVAELADQHPIPAGGSFSAGRLRIEFIPISHTIPDSVSLAIDTPAGRLIYTSDFKFGEQDGKPEADVDRLRQLGDEGVLVLLSDCVRVERPGRTPPERVVTEALERIIAQAPGRVIVTTLASNIGRVAQVIEAAQRHGRRTAVAGRSMEQNLRVATDLGYVSFPEGAVIELGAVRHLPPREVVLITTGSQGEPTSVLARLAVDDYRPIHLQRGDTVVISATPVPGNEETFSRTVDNLFRRGAHVIYGPVAPEVHVSGHASRDELREMIDLVRPRYAVPLHGEYRMMALYQMMAVEVGLAAEHVLLPDIGDVLEFGRDQGRKTGHVTAGSVLVDGLTVGEVTETVLRERGRLAEDGVVVAAVAVSRETGEVVAGPDLMARGFVHPDGHDLLDRAVPLVRKALRRQRNAEIEYGFLVGKIREVLSRFIYDETHRRPMILPVVTEV